MRKLFKGGNYSRAETICGNTVNNSDFSKLVQACSNLFKLVKTCPNLFLLQVYERDLMQPEDWPYEVIPEPSLKHEMRGGNHNFSTSGGSTSLLKPNLAVLGRNSGSKSQLHRSLNNSESGSPDVGGSERVHSGSERDKWNR